MFFVGYKVYFFLLENVVILCEGYDLESFNSFGFFLVMDKSILFCYGFNVKVEVVDMSFEEIVYFLNG